VIGHSRSSLRHWLMFAAAIAIVVIAPLAAAAASPYRIGVITEAWAANHPAVEGLKEGLREFGLIEGRDVAFDIHFTLGKSEATAAAAAALVKAGVSLIFTSGEAAVLAARNATPRIPIVFTLVGDPVAVGIVKTLAHPGGNITGVTSRVPELAPKRLEILKTLAPEIRRVWFVYYGGDVTDTAALGNLYDAASKLGVEVLGRAVNDASQLTQIFREFRPGDAFLAPSSDTLDIPVAIHEMAVASRAPAIFQSAIWVSHGAVVSYGPDLRAQGVQAAHLVAKIIRGAKPQDVPVEGAEHIHLGLNLKSAGLLGLPVPRKLLFRANVVER
jgi:putative ABC transport system substrate-binding protein